MAGRDGTGPEGMGPFTGRGGGGCRNSGVEFSDSEGKGLRNIAGFASMVCGAGYGIYRMWRRGGWCGQGFWNRGGRVVPEKGDLEREAGALKERLRLIERELKKDK